MKRRINIFSSLLAMFIVALLFSACHPDNTPRGPVKFEVLDQSVTGLSFNNKLTPTQDFNVFKYMYYYNGAGVGAGDFNNDGLIDVFFASNQSADRLYLNTGGMHFKDVTTEAKIPADSAWSTGVSVIDINNDGLLDLYICRVGKLETLNSHNELLVCQGIDKNGIPQYLDKSAEYGLNFSGFSTQAVFFDYDMDGDLDMYLLNHTIHQAGTFGLRQTLLNTFSALSGDHIFRNDGGHFTDVTEATGIHHSVIGYGLGICVSDINLDGYPDVYVGNDFHENDYLYINSHHGTFTEEVDDHLMHTSKFSMGVDIADANNDGFAEIVTMDMMPFDAGILKRSQGENSYDIYQFRLSYGYNHQYTRNNLQYNRRNGLFSEIGLYANVFATDWSWCPLWMDFDNDGLKDLFITNGIPKRLNDIDNINYVSDMEIQSKVRNRDGNERDMGLIDKFPQIKIPNKFYSNAGDLIFNDLEKEIGNDQRTYSNGAAYADFDQDGDLDLVVNNIDDAAMLYQNKSNDAHDKAYAEIHLKGSAQNINAIGSKVVMFANGGIRTYEKYPVHGFLSSMEIPMHIGLSNTRVDSAFLVWPDNTYQPIEFTHDSTQLYFQYKSGLPVFDYSKIGRFWNAGVKPMTDITDQTGLLFKHTENPFAEFERDPLVPHMFSTEGPALAVADVNQDGLDDVFIGAARAKRNALFIQQANGKFYRQETPEIDRDSVDEDVDACWADVNHDGFPDLVVASGGNEFFGRDPHLSPRVYINDGKAHFSKLDLAFDSIYVNASCVVAGDFNGDGQVDLFIGSKSVPTAYGQIPNSYLLQNNGRGKFTDVTPVVAPQLQQAGMVTQAIWVDLDKDGDLDLVVSLDWGGIDAYVNTNGKFTRKVLTDKKGWWNFVLPVDIDNDGDIDLIAGNLGLNSRLKATAEQPIRLYYNDFDDNGKKEQVLTYYLGGQEIPFANKEELEKQLPGLRKKFLYAEDFSKATLNDLFGTDKLSESTVLTANYFSSAILINQGKLNFNLVPLPWQAQLSPYRDAAIIDANGDQLPDILMVGNFYENNIQMGRNDADFGTLLLNKGGGKFGVETLNGLAIKGQSRHVRQLAVGKQPAYVIARNNDSVRIIANVNVRSRP